MHLHPSKVSISTKLAWDEKVKFIKKNCTKGAGLREDCPNSLSFVYTKSRVSAGIPVGVVWD